MGVLSQPDVGRPPRDTQSAEPWIIEGVWFTVIGIVFVVLMVLLGTSMLLRFTLRRRIRRAEAELPDSDFSGTALLMGTNFDDELRGIGAMAVTPDSLVFVTGSDRRFLHIPREGLVAGSHRRTPRQRKPSLRIQWAGNIAQFEVTHPTVEEWVEQLNRVK